MNGTLDVTARPRRILVVDDERHNRDLLEIMLLPEGFEVMTAANGEEALAMVAMYGPDLVLLDVMMPGLTGYEVASQIKASQATRNMPVIMVTALDDRDARMRGLDAGAEDFLTKPVDRAELCVRVRNLLRLKAHGDYYNRYSQELEDREHSREEQMRFKDEFLSHVSHELRSPLTAIKQFTSILLHGLAGSLTAEQRQYQQIVLKNVQQLQAMIDDLLEVTRLQTGKLSIEAERMSVADAVTDAFDTLRVSARARGVTLSRDVPADLPWVYADATRVRQILTNLLDNAIKFSEDGGAVSLQVRMSPNEPEFLQISVSDMGCGVSPQFTERIFERLYQPARTTRSSREGLGLGLYICKDLVTRQGGQIGVTSLPHQGSTFFFTLPVFALHTSLAAESVRSEPPIDSQSCVGVSLS